MTRQVKHLEREKKAGRTLRKWLIPVLAIAVMFVIAPFAWGAATTPVTTTDVYMRSGPANTAAILRVIKEGTALNVVGQDGNWYKVDVNGTQGYVHSNNVRNLVGTSSGGTEASSVSGVYKMGSTGEEVRKIQQMLKDHGYFSVMPTGLFSTITQQSVMNFQRDNNLVVDGIVGAKTLAALSGTGSSTGGNAGGSASTATGTFRKGQTSEGIRAIQQKLKAQGYFTVEPTGFFGTVTYDAVIKFQRDKGLAVDGVVGAKTLAALFPDGGAPTPDASSPSTPSSGGIEEVSWSQASTIFKVGMICEVVDVRTGKSFNAIRIGGRLHADFGPATAADTVKFTQIVGTYTWDRRPVLLKVDGRTLAASINCMPHDTSYISGNNLQGMLCMHFRDSRTHASDAVCPLHQSAITEALNSGR